MPWYKMIKNYVFSSLEANLANGLIFELQAMDLLKHDLDENT